ncbi:hypothetical protein SDRG_16899 [Saprolegnia diclina VS20]|uniref:Methyltransferase domain-containing protein n=1 Tax=Saprolegnia diclina (strain VS20) TaxID=1156394 RepID=T0QZR3_SAPDV|nr:hypothetical protein SDRG_16899 [Saprolegnia diclina VS20]EQC25228.1 hypothetical protein SDRG_16899 [Saprolegnia diclina VS20]|eukprot:XP_008621345.1 hypothetical protein SDRG_16899 [Saprolegnia diclina VS20]
MAMHWSDDDEGYENEQPFMWLEGDSLAPPCQSDYDIVQAIIDFAHVQPTDVVFDLGCGDGRICIGAARQHGCRAVGIEIEAPLIAKFEQSITKYNLQDKVRMLHADLMDADLSEATVIVTYLLPEALTLLAPKLEAALARGCRIVSNTWGIPGMTPSARVDVGQYANVPLYLYASQS